jgi:rhodanese-related sulfurtransferase
MRRQPLAERRVSLSDPKKPAVKYKHEMKFSLLIIASMFFYGSLICQVPDSLKIKSLHPKDFQMAFRNENGALLIDVREFFEFRKSRLKGAVNIPSSGNLDSAADTINKENTLFFYCTSGFRSKRVAKHFYDKGYRKLYSLDGGIMAWKKDGMPVEKKRLRARDARHKEDKP